MAETLSSFIKRNSNTLIVSISPAVLQTLSSLKTSTECKAALLDERDNRLIDTLILSDAKACNELLQHIIRQLSPEDWYEVLKAKRADKKNVIDLWLENNAVPLSAFENIISHLPSSAEKIDILTHSAVCDRVGGIDVKYSMITHYKIPFNTRFQALRGLNDQEMEEVVLSFEGGLNNRNILLSCHYFGNLDQLLQQFKDPKVAAKLKDYIKVYYLKKKGSHFLGIKDKHKEFNYATNQSTSTSMADDKNPPSFEGLARKNALDFFYEALKNYKASAAFVTQIHEIDEAFRIAVDTYNSTTNEKVQLHKKRIDDKELVIIPSGWPAHSITVATIGNFLIIANRGEGKHPKGGCIIYQLENPLSEDDIRTFVRAKSKQKIEDRINAVVKKDEFGKPVIFHAVPLHAQKYGSCSIANKKGIVAGLLPVLKHLHAVRPSETHFSDEIISTSHTEYKRFTHYSRNLILTEIINELSNNLLNENELVDALSDFCNQHLDLNKESEMKLLSRIANEIPEKSKVAFMERLDPYAKTVLQNFKDTKGTKIPPILITVKDLMHHVDLDEQEDLIKSLQLLLSGHRSVEESYKWCDRYYKILIKGKLYSIFLEHFSKLTPLQRYEIFSKRNSEKLTHVPNVFLMKFLRDQMGADNFNKLLHYEVKPGEKGTLLNHYLNNFEIFQFLLNNMSDSQLRESIENNKNMTQYHENLLNEIMVELNVRMSDDFLIHKRSLFENRFQCLKSIANRLNPEEVREWMLEKNVNNQCGFEYSFENNAVFSYVLSFFNDPDNLFHILSEGGENALFKKAIKNSDDLNVIVTKLSEKLPDEKIRQLLTTDLAENIRLAIENYNLNSIKTLVAYADPQKVQEILSQHKEQLLIQFSDDDEAVKFIERICQKPQTKNVP